MKLVDTKDAVGTVLCHDITQIIKGVTKDARFRKGHVVKEEDIPVLLSLGKDHLYVWEAGDDMLHENDAARILCDLCKNEGMKESEVKEGKIELSAEYDGLLKIDKEKLQKDISNAVTTGRTLVNLDVDGCYIDPAVYSDELTEDCQQMNELTDVVITYDFSDRKETVDRTLLKEWLSRDEDGNLMLDHRAIASYVGQLASKYDTVGIERSFSTYDNREVTVSGGTYGWLIDQPKEADALYQAIMDKKTQVREPVYAQEAASRDTNDIGYSYVEVNLTDRRLVLYKSGNPVVDTGIAISSSTPAGVYSIEEKKNQQTVGNMTTDCWMSFTDDLAIYGDPGLNLNTVTDTEEDSFESAADMDFGSDLTSWTGTEGCIVLPEEAAQELYQNVETGMPVVIYK